MRTKVLILCAANRYRSPLAAAFLGRYSHLDVRSAGFNPGGKRAGKPVRDEATRLGFDLGEHRSVQIVQALGDWASIIVVMNPTQLEKINTMFGVSNRHKLLGSYLTPKVDAIPDLGFISAGSPDFERVVGMIKDATGNLAECLKPKSIASKR